MVRPANQIVREPVCENQKSAPREAHDVTNNSVPAEHLSPLAALVDEVLTDVGYEMAAATNVINDAVPGYGGLFDPDTTSAELLETSPSFREWFLSQLAPDREIKQYLSVTHSVGVQLKNQ